MVRSSCPDPALLRSLLEGGSAGDRSLHEHLESCPACRQALEGAAASASFWSRAAEHLGRGPADGAALGRVIAELEPGDGPPSTPSDEPPAVQAVLDALEPTDQPGTLGRLAHYDVIEVAGRGGMGIVLKALDARLRRVVAIKVLAPRLAAHPAARGRFLRESQAAAAVRDDHVITIHAVEEANGLPYIVMEYVEGPTLQQRLDRDGPLDLPGILRIGMQAASGLAAAHAQGLIHRDVKPANILLENHVERVKITDFGLARAVDDAGESVALAGTPHYMAPEQARGGPIDQRADLYGLGGVLYAICTGGPPFADADLPTVLRRVCDETPQPVLKINPKVPVELTAIVERLLAKDPADRFQTAEEVAALLASQLARLQRQPPEPGEQPEPMPSRVGRPGGRRLAFGGAMVLMLAGSLGLTDALGVTRVAGFVGTVLRIGTPDGALVVHLDDPSVRVSIDDGAIRIHGAGVQEVRLRPGQHSFRATRDGTPIRDELLTISRGGKQIVRIGHELPTVPAEELGRFEGHSTLVRAVAVTRDGRRALTGSWDQTVRLWDLARGEELRCFDLRESGPGARINSVAIAPDGRRALAANRLGTVWTWDLETGQELGRLEFGGEDGRPASVNCVAFFPDGQRAVCAGADGWVRVWDVTSGDELHRFREEGGLWSVEVSPDGRWVLVAGGTPDERNRPILGLWDAQAGQRLRTFDGHEKGVFRAAFAPDGRSVLSASIDKTVRRWDIASGRQLARLAGHAHNVLDVAFTPDGRRALSCGDDGMAWLWDLESGRGQVLFSAWKCSVQGLAITPDGRRALFGLGDGAVTLWGLPGASTPGGSAVPVP